jgi:hypothetical protein
MVWSKKLRLPSGVNAGMPGGALGLSRRRTSAKTRAIPWILSFHDIPGNLNHVPSATALFGPPLWAMKYKNAVTVT